MSGRQPLGPINHCGQIPLPLLLPTHPASYESISAGHLIGDIIRLWLRRQRDLVAMVGFDQPQKEETVYTQTTKLSIKMLVQDREGA